MASVLRGWPTVKTGYEQRNDFILVMIWPPNWSRPTKNACQSAEQAAVAEEASRRRSEEAERERAFQAAQLEAARAREQAARRLARRTLAGLLGASVLALTASAAGWMAYVKQGEAERNAAMA